MSKHPHARYYPASIRVGTQVISILSDDDLLFHVRSLCGDDLASLLQTRLHYDESLPDKNSILSAIERIQSDASDVVSALDSLYDQFEQ